jgi:hypothetical protein
LGDQSGDLSILDDLPGAFGRGFVVRRIGRIIDDLAVVPLPYAWR